MSTVANGRGRKFAERVAHNAVMLFKTLLVLLLIVVVASLFSGLFFINRDAGHGERAVRALTLRIALSVLIFGLLILGFHMGWIGR